MTKEEVLLNVPIESVMNSSGLSRVGTNSNGFTAKCPFHDDNNPSLSVSISKNEFRCHGCGAKGDVIEFAMRLWGVEFKEALEKLGGTKASPPPRTKARYQTRDAKPQQEPPAAEAEPATSGHVQREEEAVYSYRDELGKELFQAVRYKNPKTFRQRHQVDGKWVFNLEGVRRVLYNLPKILKTQTAPVWIVEGEKDCDNLSKCGFTATTNPMGAGKWLEGYSECLAGKDVVLCGDNDKPGQEHMAKVLEFVAPHAKTCRIVTIPLPCKDASDFIAKFDDKEAARRQLIDLMESATVLTKGIAVPVQTIAELEANYRRQVESWRETTYDMGSWLPSFKKTLRGLVPGELVTILAATSVGKTAMLQNIALSAAPLPTLLFELELSDTTMFERFAANAAQLPAIRVAEMYATGQTVDWRQTRKLDHIVLCSLSKLKTDDIERIILQTELKTGVRPVLVLVDYIGLISGEGKSRYEKMSNVAENLRIIAKSTKTVIVMASQISRKQAEDSPEVYLSDAKDSGSVENSSSVLIGAWRDPKDKKVLKLKVLKNSRGSVGQVVQCDFRGETMDITEHDDSKPEQSDIPQI